MRSCPFRREWECLSSSWAVRKQEQRRKKIHLSGHKTENRSRVEAASLQSPVLAQSDTGLTSRASLLAH